MKYTDSDGLDVNQANDLVRHFLGPLFTVWAGVPVGRHCDLRLHYIERKPDRRPLGTMPAEGDVQAFRGGTWCEALRRAGITF